MAWQFDNAVSMFGNWVEGKLSERDKDGKPKHRIEKLLAVPGRKLKPRKLSVSEFAARGVPVTYVKKGGVATKGE